MTNFTSYFKSTLFPLLLHKNLYKLAHSLANYYLFMAFLNKPMARYLVVTKCCIVGIFIGHDIGRVSFRIWAKGGGAKWQYVIW